MKWYWLILTLMVQHHSRGQDGLQRLVDRAAMHHTPHNYHLFSTVEERGMSPLRDLRSYKLVQVSPIVHTQLFHTRPPFIHLKVPTPDGHTRTLALVRKSPLSPDFSVEASDGTPLHTSQSLGVHYRGVVAGIAHSFAVMSVYEDEVVVLFASPFDRGNIHIARLEGGFTAPYIAFSDADITNPPTWYCSNEDLYHLLESEPPLLSPSTSQSPPPCRGVRVHAVADYRFYTKEGRSTNAVTKKVEGIFNVVSALYQNDDIQLVLHKLTIWKSPDPFDDDDNFVVLKNFTKYMNGRLQGDIAHLMSRRGGELGGIAWVDRLCKRFNGNRGPASYSIIQGSYNQLPIYSWTINVVAHELGHNLGSPHTHRCAWNGNRTQIDDCGNVVFYNNNRVPEGATCFDPDNPILPSNGGTIMSYCHLMPNIRVNFSLGFGPQPSDLIRQRIANANCLPQSGFTVRILPDTQFTIYYGDTIVLHADPNGDQYTYQWYRNDQPIEGATQPQLPVTQPGVYLVKVADDCYVRSPTARVNAREFVASINFPPIQGDSGTFDTDQQITLPSDTRDTIFLHIPDTLFDVDNILHVQTQLLVHIRYGTPGNITLLDFDIIGPPQSGILLKKYNPTADERPTKRTFRTKKYWENIDPRGTWAFPLHNKNQNDVTRNMKVRLSLTITWREKSTPSDSNIITCQDQFPITLDAGIEASQYHWNTGERSRTIAVHQPGIYAVTATYKHLRSTDSIEIIALSSTNRDSAYLCEGDTLYYRDTAFTQPGLYRWSEITPQGCSITHELHIFQQPAPKISLDKTLCYGEYFMGQVRHHSDTIIVRKAQPDGCDSIIEYYLNVLPPADVQWELDTGCANASSTLYIRNPRQDYRYYWPTIQREDTVFYSHGDSALLIVYYDQCSDTIYVPTPHYPDYSPQWSIQHPPCYDSLGWLDIDPNTVPFLTEITSNNNLLDIDDAPWSLPADTYYLIANDINGCSYYDTIVLTQPDSITDNAQLTHITADTRGAIALHPSGGTPPYSYQWNTGDTSSAIYQLDRGHYSVTITDSKGCRAVFDYEIEDLIGTRRPPTPCTWRAHWLPLRRQIALSFDCSRSDEYQILLLRPDGTLVHSTTYVPPTPHARLFINMKSHPPSVYYLVVYNRRTWISAQQLIIVN